MNTQAIIEDYVNKVAAHLPRRLRNDVGLELRTLLTEQLRSAAHDAARSPDGDMAMEVLHRFGSPDEVASRYVTPGFQLIQPEYAPTFVTLAAICVAIQWAVTLPLVFSSHMTFGDWWLRWGFSALSWVGALVVYFGIGSWLQRRFPAEPDSSTRPWTHLIVLLPFPGGWRPGEPEATEWRAARNAAPLGAILTIFFIAPAWILSHLLPAGANTSWALYDGDFQRWLLPPVIALMAVRLVLFAAVLLNEGWRRPTEVIRFALRLSFVALLYWTEFGWRIFANPITNVLFKAWLLVFLLVNSIQMLVWIRRAVTRVRVPRNLAAPQNGGGH
ncbi:MAG: hypothetical protein WBE92_08395 [Steroidobacteraceae bacterium]